MSSLMRVNGPFCGQSPTPIVWTGAASRARHPRPVIRNLASRSHASASSVAYGWDSDFRASLILTVCAGNASSCFPHSVTHGTPIRAKQYLHGTLRASARIREPDQSRICGTQSSSSALAPHRFSVSLPRTLFAVPRITTAPYAGIFRRVIMPIFAVSLAHAGLGSVSDGVLLVFLSGTPS